MNTLLESQVYWRLIALAQAVPEVEHNFLFDWICGVLDGPLSTAQLSKLTLNDLKKSPPEGMTSFDDERWKSVVACLHGELPSHLDPRPVSAGESEGQLKVAFASSDGLNVNGHFGKCPLFFIYQVNEKNARLVDIRRMSSQDAEENTSGSENNEVRAELLATRGLIETSSGLITLPQEPERVAADDPRRPRHDRRPADPHPAGCLGLARAHPVRPRRGRRGEARRHHDAAHPAGADECRVFPH